MIPTWLHSTDALKWLPNQLQAVLSQILSTVKAMPELIQHKGVQDIVSMTEAQEMTLRKEVEKYCKERGVRPI